jgi:hypothetical protein
MQEITLKRLEINEKAVFRAAPKEDDCKIIAEIPCRLIDADTGAPIAIAVNGESSARLAKKFGIMKFGNPMGGGKRLAGYSQGAAKVFGYSPKRPIQTNCQTCRSTAIYRDYPAIVPDLDALTRRAWELLGKYNPDRKRHLEECTKDIKSCWKTAGTCFTSGILNKNTPLRYHYDAGNFPDSWSAMLWMVNGVRGGALALPHYNAKIVLQDGAWLFFSGQSLLHGVTPLKMISRDSYRYSLVFYANMEMRNCGTMREELENAKKRRTESESKDRSVR